MSNGHALFYPSIHLEDLTWVKHGLLFWEKVSRIVPPSFHPEDSEAILMVRGETGFLEDRIVDQHVVSQTFREFGNEIKSVSRAYLNYLRELSKATGEKTIKRISNPEWLNERQSFGSEMHGNQGMMLHIEKLDHELQDFLIDTGIAEAVGPGNESWIKVDSRIGLLYMTYLATVISRQGNLPLVSDSATSFIKSVEYGARLEENFSDRLEFELGAMMIDHYVPQDIESIDIRRIVQIRMETSDERREFFLAISDLVKGVGEIQTVEELNDILHVRGRSILSQTENLRRKYNSMGVLTKALPLAVAGCSGLAVLTAPITTLSVTLASLNIVFSGIGSYFAHSQNSSERKEQPYSYLLDIEKKLNSNLLARVGIWRPRGGRLQR